MYIIIGAFFIKLYHIITNLRIFLAVLFLTLNKVAIVMVNKRLTTPFYCLLKGKKDVISYSDLVNPN